MNDIEDRLRSVLRAVVPTDPDPHGLAAGAMRYHRRDRRLKLAGAVLCALVVLVILTMAARLLSPPPRALHADPMGTASTCPATEQPAAPPSAGSVATAPVLAAWICPDPAGPADGDGWQLPGARLTGQHVEDLGTWIEPRHASPGPGSPGALEPGCTPVVPGPAFTVALQSASGQTVSYRSDDLLCGGAGLLVYFLEALADQEADDHASASLEQALACRSNRAWTDRHEVVPLDSAFVTARLCFAPRYRSGNPEKFLQPMVPRSYQSVLLPQETLAMLNRDMTSPGAGTFTGNGACYGEGAWTYSVVGLTSSGQSKMLSTGCLDEWWVVGVSRKGFIPSAATMTALRALVPPA